MTDLKLQSGEGILLQTVDAGLIDGEDEIGIDELYLTNKNLIYTYEVSKGFFSKSDIIVEKIPLNSILVVNGIVQAEIVDDIDYGKTLQLIHKSGKRELLEITESPKKLYPVWKNGIVNAVNDLCFDFEEETYEEEYIPRDAQVGGKTVFCNQCGKKVSASSKYCNECGAQIYIDYSINEQAPKRNNSSGDNYRGERRDKRNTVYEGTLHKCPNCGEALKSFISSCPSCGYEIRDTKSTGSIKKFEKRLYAIESRTMPQRQKERSVMKTIFGKDFNGDEDEDIEAKRIFQEQKENEKISLILNYPIPNTTEDLLEFALLVTSNIDTRKVSFDKVTKAWLSKLEQIYKKAQIVIKDKNDLDQISQLYYSTKEKIKKQKRIVAYGIVGWIVLMLFLAGLEWNPVATIAIVIGIIAITLWIIFYIKKHKNQGGR